MLAIREQIATISLKSRRARSDMPANVPEVWGRGPVSRPMVEQPSGCDAQRLTGAGGAGGCGVSRYLLAGNGVAEARFFGTVFNAGS
jgi:hypothetical protein